MKRSLLSSALFSAAAFASEHMTVAVCNQDGLPAQAIEHAEAEAAYVFQSMGVEIQWTSCGAEVGAQDARVRPDFIVRVRTGGHISKVGPTSLEAMGRAFLDPGGVGYLVDTYYGAIHELTLLHPIADGDQVLGCTIVHELGHLLMGPGHRPNGIMRAAWSEGELAAISQRRLKFNQAERATILRKLHSRAAGADEGRGNEQRQQ